VGQGASIRGDVAPRSGSSEDTRRLHQHEVWRDEMLLREDLLRPGAVRPGVDEKRHRGGGVDDNRHRRSASRWPRILAAGRCVPVRAFRSRILARTTSVSGRLASSMSLPQPGSGAKAKPYQVRQALQAIDRLLQEKKP